MADRVAIMDMGRVAQVGTPRDLYRRPASRFVAEFLGETNFIEGTIAADAGATARPPTSSTSTATVAVQTPAGRLLAEADGVPIHSGARVTCSIRPEALRLLDGAPGANEPNTLPGRIVETTYLGELAQHVVELPGRTLVKVAELNPMHLAHGSGGRTEVTVSVNPADVVLLPSE